MGAIQEVCPVYKAWEPNTLSKSQCKAGEMFDVKPFTSLDKQKAL